MNDGKTPVVKVEVAKLATDPHAKAKQPTVKNHNIKTKLRSSLTISIWSPTVSKIKRPAPTPGPEETAAQLFHLYL
jgi:hypothetical protein